MTTMIILINKLAVQDLDGFGADAAAVAENNFENSLDEKFQHCQMYVCLGGGRVQLHSQVSRAGHFPQAHRGDSRAEGESVAQDGG
jgi:hypothetical protein